MSQQKKTNSKRTRKTISIEIYEKEMYDLKQLLEISKSLSSVLEYAPLIESILYICMCQMRVLSAGMYILKSFDSGYFTLDGNYSGFDPDHSIDYKISVSDKLVTFLCDTNKTYTLAEIRDQLGESAILPQLSSLEPSLLIPMKQKNHLNGILLLGERIDLGEGVTYSEYDRQQMLTLASLASIAINNAVLIEQTTTDMMTHLKLKHYFYKVLNDKLEFSALNKLPLSIMMLDIDFFKKFNDTYGHACGDYVLQQVARIISDGIRAQDMAGRYGGEEFVVMLYNTDADAAYAVAERIRRRIEKYDFEYEGVHMQVTISIGVSVFTSAGEITSKLLVEQADQALYSSKRHGRNRVTLFDAETSPVAGLPVTV